MDSVFDSSEFNTNLFFPRPDLLAPPEGTDEIYVEVEPEVQVHLRRHPSPHARFSLLFFHGNGEIASDYDELSKAFAYLGAEFVVCDYRGYGRSSGYPTLRTALQDADRIYQTLKHDGKLLDTVCVMGRSLGSASAIDLCARYPEINCCVIESGYADPIPLVKRRGLRIDRMTPEEDALFNNSRKIKKVTCPLLVMHGEDDELIVPDEAQLNYELAGSVSKTLQILEGVGHNDILMAPENAYFKCLHRFFEKVLFK